MPGMKPLPAGPAAAAKACVSASPGRSASTTRIPAAAKDSIVAGHVYVAFNNARNPNGVVRGQLDVDPAGENFCEMRLVLKSGDAPISETWLYRWTL